jgi:hypothetical protein
MSDQINMTVTNHYLYQLRQKAISLASDTLIIMLMRSGFVFNPLVHRMLINVKTNTGSIALTWSATDNSVSRGSGSFVTDGFVEGNQCTSTDGSNPGPFTIASVTALKIYFNETIVNSSGTETLTSDDELPTGNGYTQITETLSTPPESVEDNVNNKVDTTWDDVVWIASGGDIGPSAASLIFDDTSSDDTIVMGGQFLENGVPTDQTATDGNPFTVADIVERAINY